LGYERFDTITNNWVAKDDATKNKDLFFQRWVPPTDHWRENGLNSATFRVAQRVRMDPPNMERQIRVERVRIEFPHTPLSQT